MADSAPIYMTAMEIANATVANGFSGDADTVYIKEGSPYVRYQWNGNSLVPVVSTDSGTIQITLDSLQSQINAASTVATTANNKTLDQMTGTLPATHVGPLSGVALDVKMAAVDVALNTTLPAAVANIATLFTRVQSAEARLSVLEAVPPSPSPPVITAVPTVAWSGGSANVGEQGTITNGTYSGTSVTGRTFQLVNNGSNVGPVFSGATTPALVAVGTAQVLEYAAYGSAGASVTNPSAVIAVSAAPSPPDPIPIVLTGPTLAFTGGGAPDVNDTATITQGTYTGGTVTGRTGQILVNGVFYANVANGATGNTFTVPASAGSGARSLVYVELAANTGGPAVSNPSQNYTVNVPAAPTNTTAPSIAPTTANETTTLTATRGAYTVNSVAVANSTLTFTERWTADWTLTGALVGATSATMTAAWGGTTGTYTVIFSDASEKSTTLTNGLATFSWTGGVTASANIKVVLSTSALAGTVSPTIALNTNNLNHAIRYFETPTGSGVTGSAVEASNSVTPSSGTSSAIGVRTTAVTALGSFTKFASTNGSGNGLSAGSPGALRTMISGLVAGDKLALRAGTYQITSHLIITNNGSSGSPILIESYPGELAILSSSSVPGPFADVQIILNGSYVQLRNFEITAQRAYAGIQINGSNNLLEGMNIHHNLGTGIAITNGANNNIIRDSRANDNSSAGSGYFQDGGDTDGCAISNSCTGTLIEYCEFLRNSDDGCDAWSGINTTVQFCRSSGNGLGAGNGNGFKCGGDTPANNNVYYHNLAWGNRSAGFDSNTETAVTMRQNTSYNNGTWGYITATGNTIDQNIAANNASGTQQGGSPTLTNNSWASPYGNNPTFISTDPANANFLRPSVGGGYEDIGAYDGL